MQKHFQKNIYIKKFLCELTQKFFSLYLYKNVLCLKLFYRKKN